MYLILSCLFLRFSNPMKGLDVLSIINTKQTSDQPLDFSTLSLLFLHGDTI